MAQARVQPNSNDSISFETLKRLIGAPQARHIWEQKQVAEVGVVYSREALEAMRRLLERDSLPVERDIRLAAPALAAYWRDAQRQSRAAAQVWIGGRLRGVVKLPTGEPVNGGAPTKTQKIRRTHLSLEQAVEREAAIAQGMGYCPDHPTAERVKPREAFGKDSAGPGGLRRHCMECERKKRKLVQPAAAKPEPLVLRERAAPRTRLMTKEFAVEKAEALAQGMGYCPNHPTKEERIQPSANFYPSKSDGGLMYRCKACVLAYGMKRRQLEAEARGPITVPPAKLAGLKKAQEIVAIARQLEKEGMEHSEALAEAKRKWVATNDNGNDSSFAESVADPKDYLPPVPEESDRPYEADELELVSAIAEEERNGN